MAIEASDEVESVDYAPAKDVAREGKTQEGKENALKNIEPVDYKPTSKYSFVEKTKAMLRQKHDDVAQRIKEEQEKPRKLERLTESAGNAALDTARRAMGAHKNEKGEWVRGRSDVSGYVLGRQQTFVTRGGSKGKGKKGKGSGFNRASYIRQQSIQGNPRSHVINPDRRRVGPQSESEYNDNLPQHFGPVDDYRATTASRLFDVYNLRSPIEAIRSKLPRFWDKPVGLSKPSIAASNNGFGIKPLALGVNVKRTMFKKGVFG
jgi:hypothetical protein